MDGWMEMASGDFLFLTTVLSGCRTDDFPGNLQGSQLSNRQYGSLILVVWLHRKTCKTILDCIN